MNTAATHLLLPWFVTHEDTKVGSEMLGNKLNYRGSLFGFSERFLYLCGCVFNCQSHGDHQRHWESSSVGVIWYFIAIHPINKQSISCPRKSQMMLDATWVKSPVFSPTPLMNTFQNDDEGRSSESFSSSQTQQQLIPLINLHLPG